jgi:hypothetical protein
MISPQRIEDRVLPLSHADGKEGSMQAGMALSARENQPMKSGVQKSGTESLAIFSCSGAAFVLLRPTD